MLHASRFSVAPSLLTGSSSPVAWHSTIQHIQRCHGTLHGSLLEPASSAGDSCRPYELRISSCMADLDCGLGAAVAAASSVELPPALSMRSLTEAASAAQARGAYEVLGTVEPGDALPVPHGWRSSGARGRVHHQ